MRTTFATSAVTTAVSAMLVACGGGDRAGGAANDAMSAMSADVMSPMAAAVPMAALTINFAGGQGRVYSVPGGVDCTTSTCVGNIPQGTVVSLRAVAAPGFAFDGWEAANGVCSDVVSCNVTMSGPRTVTARFVAADPLAACSVTRSSSTVAVIAESHPKLLLANAELKACLQEKFTRRAPEAMRLKALVDVALGGGKPYNFSPWFAALVFQMSGEVRYRDLAVRLMDDIVKSEEALIASGTYPAVQRDSYLEVDWYLGNLARVYDWAYDGLTAEQKTRWIAYGNQAAREVFRIELAGAPLGGLVERDPDDKYGLARQLIAIGAVQRDFLAAHTTGFAEFETFVAEFTLERTAAESGVPANTATSSADCAACCSSRR